MPIDLPLDSLSTTALAVVSGVLAVGALYTAAAQSATSKLADDGKTVAKLARRLPGTSWLLGELPDYLRNSERVHDWMTEKTKEMDGAMWRMVIPGLPDVTMVSDPAAIDEILHTKFTSFRRGEAMMEALEPLVGFALLNSDGQRWHHQRKAAAKFFTAKALRVCMSKTMLKNMGQMNAAIDKCIAANSTIELDELFHAFAMQTFAEVGLGVELKWIGQAERSPLEQYLFTANSVTMLRFRLPPFLWRLQSALNIGAERELTHAMRECRKWMRSVITESLANIAKRRESGETEEIKSVIELFIEHSNDGVEGMGPDDLVDFMLTFVIAAHDTSAVTLAWFMLEVMKQPRVAQKIREEMDSVLPGLGVTSNDTYLTTDHVQKLVYLEATIKEVLRLHPAAPIFQREAAEDVIIAGDTFIPKGSIVGIPSFAIGRLTQVWGPDAEEFKPERWIDPKTGDLIMVPSNKLTAFGHGPRNCVGIKLAMVELRVVTANLMHRYDFTLAAPNSGMYTPALSLMLKDPVHVNVKRL